MKRKLTSNLSEAMFEIGNKKWNVCINMEDGKSNYLENELFENLKIKKLGDVFQCNSKQWSYDWFINEAFNVEVMKIELIDFSNQLQIKLPDEIKDYTTGGYLIIISVEKVEAKS